MIAEPKSKNRSTDRVFIFKIKDGTKPLSSIGLTDPRLFSGENKLHAVQNPRSMLWSLKYDFGTLPPVLKQKFTSFEKVRGTVEKYFFTRNILIEGVID